MQAQAKDFQVTVLGGHPDVVGGPEAVSGQAFPAAWCRVSPGKLRWCGPAVFLGHLHPCHLSQMAVVIVTPD